MRSGRYATENTTSRTPALARRSSWWRRKGRSTTGTTGWGAERVSGGSRVPFPPGGVPAFVARVGKGWRRGSIASGARRRLSIGRGGRDAATESSRRRAVPGRGGGTSGAGAGGRSGAPAGARDPAQGAARRRSQRHAVARARDRGGRRREVRP